MWTPIPGMCPSPNACAQLYHTGECQTTMYSCFGLVRAHQHGMTATCQGGFLQTCQGTDPQMWYLRMGLAKQSAHGNAYEEVLQEIGSVWRVNFCPKKVLNHVTYTSPNTWAKERSNSRISQVISMWHFNRPFPNYLWSHFQSASWCASFHKKISFHSHANERFEKEWLTWKKRLMGIRKWPINVLPRFPV